MAALNQTSNTTGNTTGRKSGPADRNVITDELGEEMETTNPKAVREASRLGKTDSFFVKSDFDDSDEREGEDQPDGRASPLANADNPEK